MDKNLPYLLRWDFCWNLIQPLRFHGLWVNISWIFHRFFHNWLFPVLIIVHWHCGRLNTCPNCRIREITAVLTSYSIFTPLKFGVFLWREWNFNFYGQFQFILVIQVCKYALCNLVIMLVWKYVGTKPSLPPNQRPLLNLAKMLFNSFAIQYLHHYDQLWNNYFSWRGVEGLASSYGLFCLVFLFFSFFFFLCFMLF